MSKRPWIYLQNPFLTATNENYVRARAISIFHDTALQANMAGSAVLQDLYVNRYHPVHLAFMAAYEGWQQQGNIRQGKTLSLTQQLALLSGNRINSWDNAIQAVYDKSTPEYKALLPDHRYPFQAGAQEDRVSAVHTLAATLGNYPSLAAVATQVSTFAAGLDTAFADQKTHKSQTTTASDNVEAARIAMCTAQYHNLGALIQLFSNNPAGMEPFFDLAHIRDHEQAVFTGNHLAAGTAHTVVQHTFASSDEVLLGNTGKVSLQYYLAATADALPAGTTVMVAPGSTVTVSADSLGDVAANVYLTVYNGDAMQEGKWMVEVV